MGYVGGLIAGLIAFFLCCTCVCATCSYVGKNTAQGTGLSREEVQKWHTQMRIIEPYCSTREPELDTVWVLQGDGGQNGGVEGARSPVGSGGRLSPNPSPGRRSSHEDGGGMGGGIGGGGAGGGGMGHGHGDDGGMGGGGGGRHGGGQNNKNKKPGQKKSGTKGSKK